MARLTFKQYNSFMDGDLNEEQINEIFGIFRNNEKIRKLKADKEALELKKKALQKEKDAIFAKRRSDIRTADDELKSNPDIDDSGVKWDKGRAGNDLKKAEMQRKKREADEHNGGFDTAERGTLKRKSPVGKQHRSGELDWVAGMTEAKQPKAKSGAIGKLPIKLPKRVADFSELTTFIDGTSTLDELIRDVANMSMSQPDSSSEQLICNAYAKAVDAIHAYLKKNKLASDADLKRLEDACSDLPAEY